MNKIVKSLLVVMFIPTAKGAPSLLLEPIQFEVRGTVAYGSANSVSTASPPILIPLSLGATIGYKITDSWLAGVSSDFTFINQYSDPTSSGGNYRGTMWNLAALTGGYQGANWFAFLDFEFLTWYLLGNRASDGGSITYKGPLGGRIRFGYNVYNGIYLGAFFHLVSFKTESNSTSGDVDLASSGRKNFWQAGLSANYLF